jgi:hypothetical protein
MLLFDLDSPCSRKRPDGVATSDLVLSAHVGGNAEVFPLILDLHVPKGSVVADVTYGGGVFWRNVAPKSYTVKATDIAQGVDCRSLPYQPGEIDCVVLDPPYMEGFFRNGGIVAGAGTHNTFRNYYRNGGAKSDGPKYHAAVLDLYQKAGDEALRVLRDGGVFVVKCQDEVSANLQHLTHVELIAYYAGIGFYCKDLFVVVRTNKPGASRILRQAHARKNHSYFLVFIKTNGRNPRAKHLNGRR